MTRLRVGRPEFDFRHPASYSGCTGGSFPGCIAARVWRWPLTSI